MAAQFCDVNGDGRPDLYVCNDFHTPDRFWINDGPPGEIRFRSIPRTSVRHTSQFSMGVDFGDLNRDGRPDFVVVDMLSPDHVRRLTMLDGTPSVPVTAADPLSRPQSDANTLFLQRADGSFAEVAAMAGVTATDWSWTPALFDVDLDGWLDLLVTAGQERASRDLDGAEHMKAFRRAGLRTDAQIFRERQRFPRLPARLQAFRNRGIAGPGEIPVFDDVGVEWGLEFSGVSHGMGMGDLDGDGDLDLVINHLNAPAGLFQNNAPAPRILVRVVGRAPNTSALGARLRFGWGTDPESVLRTAPQSAQIFGGGRYLSSDEFSHAFACPGPGRGVLEVRWPSGRVSVLSDLTANQRCDVEEPVEGSVSGIAGAGPGIRRLRFEGLETGMESAPSAEDDFSRQPLMPRRQSTRIPALAWSSRASGSNTLWIGGSTGQAVRQVTVGRGSIAGVREWGPAVPSAALIRAGDSIMVAESPRTGRGTDGTALHRFSPSTGAREPIPCAVTSPGSLAMTDGGKVPSEWLFVGGGPVAGRYPQSDASQFLRIENGVPVPQPPVRLGLVSASAFADLDRDGQPELILAGEWGSPQILRQTNGGWASWNPAITGDGESPLFLSGLTGWWQSLAVADFDGDGRSDLVLGNWGLNSPYALLAGPARRSGGISRPLLLIHGGGLDPESGVCLEGYTGADGRLRPVRSRADLAPHLPWLTDQFPTHRSFAEATLPEILGDRSGGMIQLECRWMASVILLNRGDHFEQRPLPGMAQLGPLFALAVADFDGDGHRDLYGAQGFFGHNFGMPREDAGEGVFLLGQGDGQFVAVPSAETGVRVLGEQRAAIAVDLDGDDRVDLALGIYGGPLTFLLNRRP